MAKYETLATPNQRSSELDDPHADACRKLWQAVLLGTILDALGRRAAVHGSDTTAKIYARHWLTTPSADFHMVCTFAGVESEVVWRWAQKAKETDWDIPIPTGSRGRHTHSAEIVDRRTKVAEMLASGMSRKAIAQALGTGEETIRRDAIEIKSGWAA